MEGGMTKLNTTAYAAPKPTWDKGDCSVRALMCAVGCSYETASALFSAAGRQLKKGTLVGTSRQVYETWLKMRPLPEVKDWPIAAFAAVYDKGSYIVHRRGHAFAVINGVVADWPSMKPTSIPME